ncbi:AzlD domain-containing protein [Lactobacillus sp. ESL0791]|uniref:AzlD domain-containing protein n=1 Tax=Lactobacillus sp. ESL0791 TaxID=2983234 RepID=UPI0023F8D5FC|nr:AzlD domain-containing protein [Lactobacillus sp. ESL0791]MDF7637869.1 AzlD domain-containing protein [Lactobacillus sp. ESL0791]
MPTSNFILLTTLVTGLVTWLSRVSPFILLKKMSLPHVVIEFLSFVPIAIMSVLWFEQIFVPHLGHLPGINYLNLLSSLPTVLAAVLSKNLLVIVVVGVVSAAIFNLVL